VTTESPEPAARVTDLVREQFSKIGLELSTAKSTAIVFKNGQLSDENIKLSDVSEIKASKQGERIRYLGCSFEERLKLDENIITKLTQNLLSLGASTLLNPTQKINLINAYIFPSLVYQLQAAPLSELNDSITSGL